MHLNFLKPAILSLACHVLFLKVTTIMALPLLLPNSLCNYNNQEKLEVKHIVKITLMGKAAINPKHKLEKVTYFV